MPFRQRISYDDQGAVSKTRGAVSSSRLYARNERLRRENRIFILVLALLLAAGLLAFFYDAIVALLSAESTPSNYWKYQFRYFK